MFQGRYVNVLLSLWGTEVLTRILWTSFASPHKEKGYFRVRGRFSFRVWGLGLRLMLGKIGF